MQDEGDGDGDGEDEGGGEDGAYEEGLYVVHSCGNLEMRNRTSVRKERTMGLRSRKDLCGRWIRPFCQIRNRLIILGTVVKNQLMVALFSILTVSLF